MAASFLACRSESASWKACRHGVPGSEFNKKERCDNGELRAKDTAKAAADQEQAAPAFEARSEGVEDRVNWK